MTMPATANRPSPPRRLPILAVVAGLVVVAAVVAVVASRGGDDDDAAPADESPAVSGGGTTAGDDAAADPATASVAVDGEALPPLPEGEDDPAVGEPMPVLSGTGIDGQPLVVGADGPGVIVFVAHWCPHCQREVPLIQDWLAGGGLPEGASIMAVATGTDPTAPNYPPADWLRGEGWEVPTLLDSGELTAADAAGLTAYPFFVFVDGEGRVAARATGELDVEEIAGTLRSLAAAA
jgi:cytochrome c biogenesis protein CcmG, thiol:disulfide interchange protein DsbE